MTCQRRRRRRRNRSFVCVLIWSWMGRPGVLSSGGSSPWCCVCPSATHVISPGKQGDQHSEISGCHICTFISSSLITILSFTGNIKVRGRGRPRGCIEERVGTTTLGTSPASVRLPSSAGASPASRPPLGKTRRSRSSTFSSSSPIVTTASRAQSPWSRHRTNPRVL